jgi:polyphosphate kinase
MSDKINPFINRELSWLGFNQRVLDEAADLSVPLLERLKFLAITSANLDEFFMVRVGGLQLIKEQGRTPRDLTGLTPTRQLEQISRRTREMIRDQYACFQQDLEPALYQARIRQVPARALNAEQVRYIENIFDELIYPIITPLALDPDQPFPQLKALTQHLLVVLQPSARGEQRQAVVTLPPTLARFMTLPSADGHEYVHLEDVITLFVDRLFPGETVREVVPFRITRNADMQVRENEAPDLLAGMEDILEQRRTSGCVRLEIGGKASAASQKFMRNVLKVDPAYVFSIPGPLDLGAYMGLATMSGFEEYKAETWPPQIAPALRPPESMFALLSRQDLLLYHPYESFDPVVRLIEEAANDPGVLAIKQILYRTSADSPIVAALMRAAEKGKQVTVICELKARFDEARNIEWAREMESAGVQVIYGVRNLKTHAKICIIIRREPSGIRRYVHYGTGNYNEKTSRLYTDISYLTSNEDYGADAATFFNTITGYGQTVQFRKIAAAPISLRDRLLQCIESETERSAQRQKGHIMAKFNSLVDPVLIQALYRASQAGVKVELNVRGICCLRPGVPGLSDRISVISIVDRFLEHARIMYFRNGGTPLYFISSADWMPRNLDKRIELLVPVEDPEAQKRLNYILKTCMKDNVKGRRLNTDGSYAQPARAKKKAIRSQEVFYQEACDRMAALTARDVALFKPHRPQGQTGASS